MNVAALILTLALGILVDTKTKAQAEVRLGTEWVFIPREPGLAVLTNACNTYIKWAEIWERIYHIPIFPLDVLPGPLRAVALALPASGAADAQLASPSDTLRLSLDEAVVRALGRGEDGRQRKEIEKLLEWVREDGMPPDPKLIMKPSLTPAST